MSNSVQFSLHDMRGVNSLLLSHRDFLNTTRGRGTSLERTEKEKRVQESPKGTYSTNAGDTGIVRPSAPSTFAAAGAISNNPPTEGVRAQYRSWRDVRPVKGAAEKVWSIGGHGSHDSQGGQVEKSIAEALAGVEPNNRSRKASHSLRFFKEGLPEDHTTKRDLKNPGRSKEAPSRGKSYSGLDQVKSKGPKLSPRDEGPTAPSSPSVDRFSPSQTPHEQKTSIKWAEPSTRDTTRGAAAGYFDILNDGATGSEEQLRAIPTQLLADIRKHHNLTPGAEKGSSFSRSIPVTASERPTSVTTKSGTAGEVSVSTNPFVAAETINDDLDKSQLKSAEEDDDSGEEQISKALFVPHKTPLDSPERTQHDKHGDSRPDQDRSLDNSNSQWLEEHAVLSQDVDDKYLSPEATSRSISPLSTIIPNAQHELTRLPATVEEVAPIDRDSYDDGDHTTLGDESHATDRDHDTTTGSLKHSSRTDVAPHHLHDHQQEPKQPLETVELIPYRHQVGGHTTIWRFSKRAVCKQLNNEENKFYEKVERFHPELLKFLPRFVTLTLPFSDPHGP